MRRVRCGSASGLVFVSARAAGDEVRFEVRDEGAGMTPDVLARAGEPFFSTRAPGAGMGLGLYLARAIVEHLGGRLALDSAEGRGTRVAIELPRDPLGRTTA
jgi:two-component system sensor histidine kinase RegB